MNRSLFLTRKSTHIYSLTQLNKNYLFFRYFETKKYRYLGQDFNNSHFTNKFLKHHCCKFKIFKNNINEASNIYLKCNTSISEKKLL